MPIFENPLFVQAAANAQSNADQQAVIDSTQVTLGEQAATIGAQATEIEYASGNGAEPANEAVELFGCFPLYRGQAHARNHRGANGSITIPVGDRFWHRPVGAGFYKGCHDACKIPLSGVAGGISHDTTADTQCPFDEMSTLAGVATQTKALEQIFVIPEERRAVYEGSVDKGEWCEPGCLGYRVHCTADAIFYNKYSHPTLRTTEYLCESTCFRIGDGMVFQHVDEDKKNVLVAITKAPNLVNPQNTRYQGTLTPRFMNALNSLKSVEGRSLTEAKLVASGKTSAEATAAVDEFVARLNHISSDSEVESGAHDDNAGLWKSGIGYCDQVIVTLIYDDVNNEVQVFEQSNYSDGIFTEVPGGFSFTGAELSVPVQDVINVLLADSPVQYEYEGDAGKYQNRLRTKQFPPNSKFGLKKVSRQAIAVAQNKTIAEVDEEQRLYSVNSNAELKSVLKWRQWKAAERYFQAHRDAAADGSTEKTYYDKKAEDYYHLANAMATHAATFDNVSDLTEPTPVSWNAGDGGLLDVQIEGGKVVSGYSYHSSRVVTIPNSAAERTFVPAYELNYASQQTRRNELQSLDGVWIFNRHVGFVYKLEAHETNPDALYVYMYRPIDGKVIPYDFTNLVPLQGYAIGGAAWNEWFDNSANVENHIKNTLTYVGPHTNPAGLELTGLMEDMHVPDSEGLLLGTRFGKIVVDPVHLRAYMYDKTFTRKFTDAGWAGRKPQYESFIPQAEAVVGVSNLPLGLDATDFVAYFESLGPSGVPRYQTEEVPFLYGYPLLAQGRDYFTWDSGSTPQTAATSDVVDRTTIVETTIADLLARIAALEGN